MDVVLGRLHGQLERPQTRKFAWPIVLLPELFASSRHVTIMAGHLVSLGWEVYLLDVYAPSTAPPTGNSLGPSAFGALVDNVRSALDTIGSEVIASGHGLGGLLALKLAETAPVRAAVALAPLIPGFDSPLFVRRRSRIFRRPAASGLPARRTLLRLVGEAEEFQRQSLIHALVPADTSAVLEIARSAVAFAAHRSSRLIISGEADVFAPWREAEKFAARIGAQFISLPGRGHWLVAGRGLERTIAHVQRFLVRALGEELLLLYEDP
jgi:pimeloyl-ACP methyl ester carboxylesterase